MELWAAIDLLQGSVVTLVQGRSAERTVWEEDALTVARRWESDGADGLHVIDLDGAFQEGSNRETIEKIIARSGVPVEVGGGIRSEGAARSWLDKGAERVVIGTIAYTQPSVISNLLATYGPERLIVAADYRGEGQVVIKGWKEGQGISVQEAARSFEATGVTDLLTTAVGRDGMGTGPDVDMVKRLVGETKMDITASGGIRDVNDLEDLERAGAKGAVVGRALYEGNLRLGDVKRSVG
jgi:phosphoribosylformimino-5-aminoimidazole carboxamide ribotide isomerase